MKRRIALAVCLIFSLITIMGCDSSSNNPSVNADKAPEGPFTNNNKGDFASSVPIKVDSEILQVCYDYTESLGYEIKDISKYRSVLLGKSNINPVHVDDDDKRNMLDENDYLIIFNEIRIVFDAETMSVLGHIPYV